MEIITTVTTDTTALARQHENKKGEAQAKLDAIGTEAICGLIAEGIYFSKIAADAGVSTGSLSNWLALPAHIEMYARAREVRADKLAEDILTIADDCSNDFYTDDGNLRIDHDAIARSRLRVDARKWLASKMFPRKYGDKLDVSATHNVSPLAEAFKRITANGSALLIGKGRVLENHKEARSDDTGEA